MPENVRVIIKAANQSVPDQEVVCDALWTVLALKTHLSSVHPAKPRVDEQRLIYSGQLLADNLVLHNTLRHPTTDTNAYTIHLVCSPPRYPTHKPPTPSSTPPPTHRHNQATPPSPPASPNQNIVTDNNREARENNRETTDNNREATDNNRETTDNNRETGGQGDMSGSTQEANPPIQPDSPVTNETTDGLRRRNISPATEWGQQTIDAASTYPTQQMPFTALQAPSAGPVQQMAAMQQMYANYMAYVQYSMQMGGVMGGLAWPQQMVQLPTTTTTTTAATPTPSDVVDPPQPPLDQIQPPEPQPQQPPPQIRMNAQGVEVDEDDEDEGMGRDWLDWMYVLSRMLVLLSVVYFYSTLSRFMLVVCIAMLLYLYQAGWFRPARRIDQPPQPANRDDQNNNINNNNNNDQVSQAEEEAEEEEDENEDDGQTDNPALPTQSDQHDQDSNDPGISNRVVEEVHVRPSILALSWTFLTTFFTSLIPEQPHGI